MSTSRAAISAFICVAAFSAPALSDGYVNRFVPPECIGEAEYLAGQMPAVPVAAEVCGEACVQKGIAVSDAVIEAAQACIGAVESLWIYPQLPPDQISELDKRFTHVTRRLYQQFNNPLTPFSPLGLDQLLMAMGMNSLGAPENTDYHYICITAGGCDRDPDGKDCRRLDLIPVQYLARELHYELEQVRMDTLARTLARMKSRWMKRQCKPMPGVSKEATKECLARNRAEAQALNQTWAEANQAYLDYIQSWPQSADLAWIGAR